MIDEPDLNTTIREIGDFIMPAALAAVGNHRVPGRWKSDVGWEPAT